MTKSDLLVSIAHLPDDTPIVDASGHPLTLSLHVWEPAGRPVVCLSASDGSGQASIDSLAAALYQPLAR